MSYLALVRHGQTTYNAQGLWTGFDNPPLTEQGVQEAKKAGDALKDIHFDAGYTSVLDRAIQTLEEIKKVINQSDLLTTQAIQLNERNYGDYTAKNKWEIKEQVGEEVFQKIRRSWDHPIPNGESLKEVYAREIPYFETEIFPQLKQGKNVIITTSGNAVRALVKYLEHIPDEDVTKVEIATGQIYLYTIDKQGNMTDKQIRIEKENKT